jgi:hypothetical protein
MPYSTQIRLRVFCDFHAASEHDEVEFFGDSESEVRRLARAAGWRFYTAQGKAMCARCQSAATAA